MGTPHRWGLSSGRWGSTVAAGDPVNLPSASSLDELIFSMYLTWTCGAVVLELNHDFPLVAAF